MIERDLTETEWREASHPSPLLDALGDRASDRKLRLFACSCCRNIWHLLKDNEARTAIELAELYADGEASQDALVHATRAIPMPEWPSEGPEQLNWQLVTRGVAADLTDPRTFAWLTAEVTIPELTTERRVAKWVGNGSLFVPFPTQASILRDIFGNPFHPVTFLPEWRTDTTTAIARQMYESRDFSAMPILADALQDAGCDSAEILHHCRGPGPHVRGCFVVDLVLRKE